MGFLTLLPLMNAPSDIMEAPDRHPSTNHLFNLLMSYQLRYLCDSRPDGSHANNADVD